VDVASNSSASLPACSTISSGSCKAQEKQQVQQNFIEHQHRLLQPGKSKELSNINLTQDHGVALNNHGGSTSARLKICVAGGAGFIGSHLAQRLKRDGHYVVVADRRRNEFMAEQGFCDEFH
ncbi:unnamed protein product, partial [Amoebophrya sp. A25]